MSSILGWLSVRKEEPRVTREPLENSGCYSTPYLTLGAREVRIPSNSCQKLSAWGWEMKASYHLFSCRTPVVGKGSIPFSGIPWIDSGSGEAKERLEAEEEKGAVPSFLVPYGFLIQLALFSIAPLLRERYFSVPRSKQKQT